jgi:hypothetical protein
LISSQVHAWGGIMSRRDFSLPTDYSFIPCRISYN